METLKQRARSGQNSSDGDPPALELRSVGDGRVFYRALARILVRRELISLGVIPDPDGCAPSTDTP